MTDLFHLETIVAILALFIGSTMFSAIGFGIAMFATPVMLLVLDPQTVVVVVTTWGAGIGVWIVVQARKDILLREILPIVIAGALGVPIGVAILKNADPSSLRIGIAVLILLLAAVSMTNLQKSIDRLDRLEVVIRIFADRTLRLTYARILGIVAGFTVGTVAPSFGVGGQLVMLFLLTSGWPRQSLRAGMALFLQTLATLAVLGFAVSGLYTPARLTLLGIVAIPSLAGLALGALLIRRMNERVFHFAVIAIIIASSIAILVREVASL